MVEELYSEARTPTTMVGDQRFPHANQLNGRTAADQLLGTSDYSRHFPNANRLYRKTF